MGRPSHSAEDYRRIAEEHHLEHMGIAPSSVIAPTWWRCTLTGVMMRKSYHAVRNGSKAGSRYRATFAESLERYRDVADRLGVEFLFSEDDPFAIFPANTKTPCKWLGPSGVVVETTYNQLAYTPRKYLLEALGVNLDEVK